MNADNCALATGFVSASYINQGQQALTRRQRQVKALLSSRKLPEEGWDEMSIEAFIRDCSAMDSNNFLDNVGVGEREGRVACPMVARRHYGLAHGIGRSGDIAAEQPKAAGSSLLAKLTAVMTADAMQIAGLRSSDRQHSLGRVTVLPLATGMAFALVLLAVKAKRPAAAQWVVWSRIDQKTCLKAITAANLKPYVVELVRQGDQLVTDVQAMQAAIEELGAENVVAVVTTSSCFAPRGPDALADVAKLCAARGVPHIVNNAYGVQSAALCKALVSAWTKGRVDALVQSTDKNFMVPVGGAVVAEPANAALGIVEAVNGSYPGRAAVGAHLDLLMTLLHWGAAGWRKVLAQREEVMSYLRERLAAVAAMEGERLLDAPANPISLALTLDSLAAAAAAAKAAGVAGAPDVTFFGSMLWSRCVSGTRVVAPGKTQTVGGATFRNYGSHCNDFPSTYLTAAAALGTTKSEVDEFAARLVRCFAEFRKRCKVGTTAAVSPQGGGADGGAASSDSTTCDGDAGPAASKGAESPADPAILEAGDGGAGLPCL